MSKTTFLHTHSWLDWIDEAEPEDTRYIKKITSKYPKYRECGQRNLIPALPILGLKAPSARWRLQPVFNLGSPRPKKEVFTVFKPTLVERIPLPFSNSSQDGGRGPIFSGPPHISSERGILIIRRC